MKRKKPIAKSTNKRKSYKQFKPITVAVLGFIILIGAGCFILLFNRKKDKNKSKKINKSENINNSIISSNVNDVVEEKKEKKNHKKIKKGLSMQLFAWSCVVGSLILVTGLTYAWYTKEDREADSNQAQVMVPYYLTLRNPSDTDTMQLSLGSMPLGDKKQIVFCVTNKNPEAQSFINKGVLALDYTIELVHTDNLALDYNIYELSQVDNADDAEITASDIYTDANGDEIQQYTYWKKVASDIALSGTDVSVERQKAAYGFDDGTDVEESLRNTNNRGTYISYENGTDGNKLHLSSENELLSSEYFVLEVNWNDSASADFDNYKKETELIYVLVKALQPRPEK